MDNDHNRRLILETERVLPRDFSWHCNDTGKVIALNETCNGVNDCGRSDDEGPACAIDNCDIRNGGCAHHCHNTPRGTKTTHSTRHFFSSTQKMRWKLIMNMEITIPVFDSTGFVTAEKLKLNQLD